MRNIVLIVFFFSAFSIYSQNDFDSYREDQLYVGVYYNSLGDKLTNFKENKFSSSFNLGFIRDIPLSKSGKFAIGLGVGLGINSFNNNLKLSSDNLNTITLLNSRDIPKKNTFNFSEIQLPFEIRWRNSSSTNYKFWRIYTGLKYSRVISSSYTYESNSERYKLDKVPINIDQLGFTLNIGYNTWNIGLYKSLRPFFNKKVDDVPLVLEQFKLGLIFYIL
tara:strand:+ start:2345 stop:3004 length:660 start_codon:yes stop_codon:yes gene_type:complete